MQHKLSLLSGNKYSNFLYVFMSLLDNFLIAYMLSSAVRFYHTSSQLDFLNAENTSQSMQTPALQALAIE